MRASFMLLLMMILAGGVLPGCSMAVGQSNIDQAPELPELGNAPELTNETWLNVEQPLRLKDLRGKVVLLDMWTFG